MKKGITIIILLLLVVACKEENNPLNKIKEATNQVKEAKQGLDNLDNIIDGAEDMQKNIENLSGTTPVNNETIKAWMPEKIGDLKRTKYDIGQQMGFAKISNVHLIFKTEDKKRGIDVKVIDGAGNGASVISMNNLMLQVDVDSESETGYKKTQIFDSQRVMVDYSNPTYANRALFKYIINNRIYVEARGWQMKPDEFWDYLTALKIETLIE